MDNVVFFVLDDFAFIKHRKVNVAQTTRAKTYVCAINIALCLY